MVLRYGIRGADTYHLPSRALEPFLKAWHWMFVSSFSFAILTFGNDRSGHAEKLFLTSEVTTAFTGSMFKVQCLRQFKAQRSGSRPHCRSSRSNRSS
jgi:hypothetical protein